MSEPSDPTVPEPSGPSLRLDLDRLGPRAWRRAEPRASVVAAAAGCAIAVLGALLMSGDAAAGGGSAARLPGLILMGLVVAGAVALQRGARTGALATAGTVGVLLGVPPLVHFVVSSDAGTVSESFSTLLGLSLAAWLVAYAVGGGRGRPAYLGAAAIGLWLLILDTIGNASDLPALFFARGLESSFEGPSQSETYRVSTALGSRTFGFGPDLTTLALLSFGVGAAYLFASRWLDGRGAHGAATPLAFAALPAIVVGIPLLADDLHVVGAAIVALAVGAGLALHGATVGRRGTAWTGGLLIVGAVFAFVGDLIDDQAVAGVVFLLLGSGIVVAAQVLADRHHEPSELPHPPTCDNTSTPT